MFCGKRIRASQPKHPANRTGSEVLNRAIEAVHENDCRDVGVDDLGNACGENHVDDDGVGVMASRRLHHALAKASIRRHPGEGRHDGRQRPLHGRIEIPSGGERFEREAHCFNPLANAAMPEHHDLDTAGPKRPSDGQLRRNVAAAVHDCEKDLHGVRASASTASVISSIRSATSSTDSPRSSRSSFQA